MSASSAALSAHAAAVPHSTRLTLASLPLRQSARISGLDAALGEWAQRLADLGFLAGETVEVIARAWPGGDPMVVRVGGARYALRRAEASCVRIEPGR